MHSVPRENEAGARINITFRRLQGPPGWRAWEVANRALEAAGLSDDRS